MTKRLLTVILCLAALLYLPACDRNINQPVFDTQNIAKISFSAYYGERYVPNEYMEEITDWLASFVIAERIPRWKPNAPGTNTWRVKIEYTDGTIIEKGLDVVAVGGNAYRVECDPEPACLAEIQEK